MRVLRALRECGHHGIRFFQKAAVLAIFGLVSDELLKVKKGEEGDFNKTSVGDKEI